MNSEVNTNDGRLDCVVKTPPHIYVIEFKLNKSADPRPKVLVGVNFSSEAKTVEGWKSEILL